ncbi:MAG: IS110 family transposase [Acetobacteraceae bacterium]|nr:IS110 family transposase [Acetobacteraceae bacterium]
MPFHVGLDWGGESHAICVIDAAGAIVARFAESHDAAGLADLFARLRRIAAPAELPVAIERPSGLIVDALLDTGHPVVPIHPNVVKACRPRYRAAGGKSDPGDAFRLADILRTDGHRFRPLKPVSNEIKALRALVRGRDDLVRQRLVLANQLRALLDGFWSGAAAIFADISSPIALAFLRRYPTPDSAALLEPLGAEIARLSARLSARIEHAVAELPDGQIVMSFPRAGRVCAAGILAELGDVRERFPTEDQLAAEAGVCPVTHASGKSRGVVFRWACDKHLRAAITCFADNSRHASAWAASIYRSARDRGCKHPHAVRILARAWVRVPWRAWQDRRRYDPAQHHAARKIAA